MDYFLKMPFNIIFYLHFIYYNKYLNTFIRAKFNLSMIKYSFFTILAFIICPILRTVDLDNNSPAALKIIVFQEKRSLQNL